MAASLDDDTAHPARVARLHLQMALLHHRLARESSEEKNRPSVSGSRSLSSIAPKRSMAFASDAAGLAETALAKADAVASARRHSARARTSRTCTVWPGTSCSRTTLREALGQERYDAMLERVRTSMRSLDTRRIEARSRKPETRKSPWCGDIRPFRRRPYGKFCCRSPVSRARCLWKPRLRRALIPDVSSHRSIALGMRLMPPWCGGASCSRCAPARRDQLEAQ
jgi:hypothetical protein